MRQLSTCIHGQEAEGRKLGFCSLPSFILRGLLGTPDHELVLSIIRISPLTSDKPV